MRPGPLGCSIAPACCFSNRRARAFAPRCGAAGWYGCSSNSRGLSSARNHQPSIISCSSTRLARALRSSNPWPSNWASQVRASVRPKKRYLLLLAADQRRERSFLPLSAPLPSSAEQTMPRSGRARSRASSRYGLSLWPCGLKVASALPLGNGGLSPIQRGFHSPVTVRGPYLEIKGR